jgi:hypothetical protein
VLFVLLQTSQGLEPNYYSTGGFRVDPRAISKIYITGTDRRTVRAQTVLDCFKAYNTRYAVKYTVFAQILALCRPINLTNPIRQLSSLGYSAYSCLIGLVVLIGRQSAMNLAKSLIISNKNYCNHRAPM